MARHHTLAHGLAGEHLVCADLLLNGHRPALAPQLCPFDILAEIDKRLWRIQVKTTEHPRGNDGRRQTTPVYQWAFKKRGQLLYRLSEVDLLALVAIDTKQIAYVLPDVKRGCITIRVNDDKFGAQGGARRGYGQAGRTFAEYSLSAALNGSATMAIKKMPTIPKDDLKVGGWTEEENQLILAKAIPDAILAHQLRRNPTTMQNHRRKLLRRKGWQKSSLSTRW